MTDAPGTDRGEADTTGGFPLPQPPRVQASPSRARGGRLRSRWVRLAVVPVFVAGLIGAFALGRFSDGDREQARSAAAQAAERYAVLVTTYDYENLERDFARVLGNATGSFQDDYLDATEGLRQRAVQVQAEATGTVRDSAVLSTDGTAATVLLFVDQEVLSRQSGLTRVENMRIKMSLRKQDGGWLISALELV